MYLNRIPNNMSYGYKYVFNNDYENIIAYKNTSSNFMTECNIIEFNRNDHLPLFIFFDTITEKTIDLLFEHNYIERDDIFYIYFITIHTDFKNNIKLQKILYYMKKLYIESLIEYKNIQVYLVSPYLYQIYEYLIINGAKLQNYWMCKKIRAKYSEHINFSLHNTNKTKYIY